MRTSIISWHLLLQRIFPRGGGSKLPARVVVAGDDLRARTEENRRYAPDTQALASTVTMVS
jgi:hypothetical protein